MFDITTILFDVTAWLAPGPSPSQVLTQSQFKIHIVRRLKKKIYRFCTFSMSRFQLDSIIEHFKIPLIIKVHQFHVNSRYRPRINI